MNLKNFIKLFIPEIILIPVRTILLNQKINHSNKLFDGNEELFKKNITSDIIYGEYGCGKSTEYILDNYDIPIYSVDTSKFWVNKISKKKNNNLNIKHINVGDVENWGVPKNYEYRENFKDYMNWIWQQKQKPNVVLIDGRFRVCCFLTTLKFCNKGTKIIFDDYVERKVYHLVEEFLKPTSFNGRQALFIVNDKSKFNFEMIDLEIDKFTYVID